MRSTFSTEFSFVHELIPQDKNCSNEKVFYYLRKPHFFNTRKVHFLNYFPKNTLHVFENNEKSAVFV